MTNYVCLKLGPLLYSAWSSGPEQASFFSSGHKYNNVAFPECREYRHRDEPDESAANTKTHGRYLFNITNVTGVSLGQDYWDVIGAGSLGYTGARSLTHWDITRVLKPPQCQSEYITKTGLAYQEL